MKNPNMILTRKAILEDLPILYEFEQGIIAYERPYDVTLKSDPINYYAVSYTHLTLPTTPYV